MTRKAVNVNKRIADALRTAHASNQFSPRLIQKQWRRMQIKHKFGIIVKREELLKIALFSL